MNQTTDEAVREFVMRELPLVTTLLLKKVEPGDSDALQELHEADDVAEMANKFFEHFNVQHANFSLNNYYPWKTKSFFTHKPAKPEKSPLTVQMFIDSAKAGCWVY